MCCVTLKCLVAVTELLQTVQNNMPQSARNVFGYFLHIREQNSRKLSLIFGIVGIEIKINHLLHNLSTSFVYVCQDAYTR